MKKSIETSLPFPAQQIMVDIDYKKVEKPSGVSYFLLVLISETKNRMENISKLLVRFGVPESLHDIFAAEMDHLIAHNIITANKGTYDARLFSGYEIGHFEMTQLGQKIFADEVIPTGETITKSVKVWYDPRTGTYSTAYGRKAGSIEKNTLTEAFCKSFEKENDDDLRQFIEARKNVDFGLKREEAITDIKVRQIDHMFATYDVAFSLDTEGFATVSFEDEHSARFAKEHYDSAFIQKSMDVKKKFQTNKENMFKDIGIQTYEQVSNLILPRDLEEASQKTGSFVIARKSTYVNQDAIVDSKILPNYPDAICALINKPGKAQVLTLGRCAFDMPDIGWNIKMNLVVEETLGEHESENLLEHALSFVPNQYSKGSLSHLIRLLNLTSQQDKVIRRFELFFPEQDEDIMNVLKEIKTEGMTLPGPFLEIYRKQALKLVDNMLGTIRIDNLDVLIPSLKWLYTQTKASEAEQIAAIASQFKVSDVEMPRLYNALVSQGYEIRDVLSFFNVFDHYAGQVFDKTPIDSRDNDMATDFSQIQSGYTTMLELLGINDYTDLITREDINNELFTKTYVATMRVVNKLSTYRKLSKHFETIMNAMDKFHSISDVLSVETKALTDPESITRKMVETFRRTSEYFKMVIYLSVKLEYVLGSLLGYKTRFQVMIKDAHKKGLYTRDEKDLLDRMRVYRNNLVHDTGVKGQAEYSFLDDVIPIVFALEEKMDEQSGRH